MKKNGEKETLARGTVAKMVNGLRSVLEDIAFFICAVLLVMYKCAVYWIARLCGYNWEDDF